MKVAVVYMKTDKFMKPIANEIARDARTRALTPDEFDHQAIFDLLVLIFSSNHLNYKQIAHFISSLNRQHVHNVALVGTYSITDSIMKKTIALCHKQDLPLMREQYTCKLPILSRHLPDVVLKDSRIYVNDMMTIVDNYY